MTQVKIVQELYDVYVMPKDPDVDDPTVLASAQHFQGRMTMSALRMFGRLQIPACNRVKQETQRYASGAFLGCALYGCKNFPDHIIVVFKALDDNELESTWTYFKSIPTTLV